MPEQCLCYSQAILCIFNETINTFHSCRLECIHSPVCFVTILPMIENTPPFTITWLALGKNDVLKRMMRMVFSPLAGTRKFRLFMDIWIVRLGMWMNRSLVRLPTFVDKVSLLVFQKYRSPHCYLLSEMCLHRTSGVRKKKGQFTDTLLSSGFAIYLKFIK